MKSLHLSQPLSVGILMLLVLLMAAIPREVSAISSGFENREEMPDTLRESLLEGDGGGIAVNEPMYFIMGRRGDTTARFQFSLRYRLLDEESTLGQWFPPLSQLYFAYTQTSLWNLSDEKRAFEDSSYRPSVFWQSSHALSEDQGFFWRVGLEHESNGRGDEVSRGIDTAFIMPGYSFDLRGRELVLMPRVYTYLHRQDGNRDIADYRGYADWVMRYGNDDSWVLQTRYRQGRQGRSSTQLDLSIPLRQRMMPRTGTYLYLQAFRGYGQTLLGYDQKEGFSFRVGLAVVR